MKVRLGEIFHIPYDDGCDVICAMTDGWGFVMDSSAWSKAQILTATQLDGEWVCPHRPDDCDEARENYLDAQNRDLELGEEIEVVSWTA
jgi:hypothetical protein